MTYTLTHNPEFNSIEIFFDGKPAAEVREALKGLKFRWHNVKKCWYGRAEESAVIAALNSEPAEGGTVQENSPRTAPAKAEKVNKFGVKVGDLFYMSWGWEQTNIDIFQVVSLHGAQSVRVKQVSPKVKEELYHSSMSRSVSFELPKNGELLKPCGGIFIKDEERGDLHKVVEDYDKKGHHIVFEGRYYARPYIGQELTESWYA